MTTQADNPTPKFTDATGKAWPLSITLAGHKRILDQTGVDLYKAVETPLFIELQAEPWRFGGILWALLEPQLQAEGLDETAFCDRLDGRALDQAIDAFGVALVNFTPARTRDVLAKAIDKGNELIAKTVEGAAANMDDPTIDQAIEAQIAQRKAAALSKLREMSDKPSTEPGPSPAKPETNTGSANS